MLNKKIKKPKPYSDALFKNLLEASSEGIFGVDSDERCTFINPAALNLLGLTQEECLGEDMHALIHNRYPSGSPYLKEDCPVHIAFIKGEQLRLSEEVLWHKSGKQIHVLYSCSPMLRNKKVVGAVVTIVDNSQRRNLEKRRDEFVSIASHELKTPVASIKGFIQILQKMQSSKEKTKYYLSRVSEQVDRLTLLVNDLLDVSRVQSGKLNLNKENFDVAELINDICEDLEQVNSSHKIERRDLESINLFADKYRLSQVLINLISNAIKYSPKSKTIIVDLEKTDNDVAIGIKDFGIGISSADINKVFEPFYQANKTIRQSFSGLGLGLHISKEIVMRHEGRISVESQKGKGSKFTVHLPIKA